MTDRFDADLTEIVAGRHLWMAEIPWLPDVLGSGRHASIGGNPLTEIFGAQIALLRAFSSSAPAGSVLQLRFLREESNRRIAIHLVGCGPTAAHATRLADIVGALFPSEYPLLGVKSSAITSLIRPFPLEGLSADQFSEVRRAIESTDPASEAFPAGANLRDPVVLPWAWSAQALLSSLALLRNQPPGTILGVHVEPARISSETIDFLQDEANRFRSLLGDDENPLLVTALAAYRRWLRELPRGALSLRVFLGSPLPLAHGLAEAIGVDLTRTWEAGGPNSLTGSFSIARPSSETEVDSCIQLIEECRASRWGGPTDPGISELQFLFDPHEANTAFRLPVTRPGGIAGVATGRIASLPRGRDAATAHGGDLFVGQSSTDEPYALSESDLRRHVLVAGVPGSGKSTTVRRILNELTERGIPWLVVDPAKSDYTELAASGAEIVRLDPEVPAFNPLTVPEGSTPAEHGSRVLAAFDAAFGFSTWWPAGWILLGRALFDAYESAPGGKPTMRSLYSATADLLRRAGYRGEGADNIKAALLGRIEFLAFGPIGVSLMADPHGGVDWARLTSRPTVIELRRFTGPQERTLIFALLLAGLVSYRESHPIDRLGHVTVLEEAHRVIGGGETVNSQGVQLFADAIAELRGSGEGFIIVDQAPSLLHPSVMKMTSTKLAHRLVDVDERSKFGEAMLLDPNQLEDLARLSEGRLVAYSSGAAQPVLVQVTPLPLVQHDAKARRSLIDDPQMEPLWCQGCPWPCQGLGGLKHVAQLVTHPSSPSIIDSALRLTGGNRAEAWCASALILASQLASKPAALRDALNTMRTEVLDSHV